jgi:hypothetical protein
MSWSISSDLAEAHFWEQGLMNSYCSLIDGALVPGRLANVVNPAIAETFATYHVADEPLIDCEVSTASRVFEHWRKSALSDRRVRLSSFADIVQDNASHLARLLVLEQGKPLAEVAEEIAVSETICSPDSIGRARHAPWLNGVCVVSQYPTRRGRCARDRRLARLYQQA